MSNTWNGMTFTNIARKGLSAFVQRLIPLRVFTTDFSADVALQGTAVATRVVPAGGTAQSLSSTHSGVRSNAVADQTTSLVTVTLNQDPIEGFHLTDEEAMQIGSGVWEDTKTRLIEQTVNSVADAILDYCFGLIINANYSNIVHTGLAAAFDLDDVVDIGNTLDVAQWPASLRNMVLSSAYYNALKKDNAIQDLSASGLPVVKAGDVAMRKVDEFELYKAPTLPPSGTPSTENLTGFVCRKECMAIAMRAVKAQAPERLEFFQVLTDPQTGATIVYRAWYDPDVGKMYHTFEALFGASVAYATALQRIRSSA